MIHTWGKDSLENRTGRQSMVHIDPACKRACITYSSHAAFVLTRWDSVEEAMGSFSALLKHDGGREIVERGVTH